MTASSLSTASIFGEIHYVCPSECAAGEFTSIQAAVDAASDGDEVLVRAGTYTAASGDAVVDLKGKRIVLCSCDGPEVTIINGEYVRHGIVCIDYETEETRIEGFTITNGWADEGGGGMLLRSNPTITNCIFRNNEAGDWGGGVGVWSAAPTITNCLFDGNAVKGTGPFEWGRGGGLFFTLGGEGQILRDCRFTGNHGIEGGGMFMLAGTLVMQDCAFLSNVAEESGGGLYILGGDDEHQILQCAFLENTAVDDGGAVYIESEDGTFANCRIEANAAEFGGGIAAYDCSPSMINCGVVNNDASEEGGGTYVRRGAPTITDCAFQDNEAVRNGGGLAIVDGRGQVQNCLFMENIAGYFGGAFWCSNSSTEVTDGLVHANGSLFGGGIAFSDGSPEITGVTFTENTAAQIGGAICSLYEGFLTIMRCNFTNNEADAGGAIFIVSETVASIVESNFCESVPDHIRGPWEGSDNCFAASCIDRNSDGVPDECQTTLFVDDDRMQFPDADYTVIQDAIDAANDYDVITVAMGTYTGTGGSHVVDLKGKAVILQSHRGAGVTFIDGGGVRRGIVCFRGETSETVIEGFTIRNCTGVPFDFNGNDEIEIWEREGGGGMMNYGGSSPTIRECIFTENDMDGMRNYRDCNPVLVSCSFIANEGTSGAGMNSYIGCNPTITNCRFRGNTTNGYGGGMFNFDSSPVLSLCIFENNIAMLGGGAISNWDGSNIEVSMCLLLNNSTSGYGGGVENRLESDPDLSLCTFEGNSAQRGGAMWSQGECRPQVESCFFEENSATTLGGGIFNGHFWSGIKDSTFCGNTPTHVHGAYNDQGGNTFSETCIDAGCVSVGGVFQVPTDVPTISQAIVCADDGDVIQVGPGFYSEALDFEGKRITIESTHGPMVTYLDGSALVDSSIVTFSFGESAESVLRGFTLFGGSAGTIDANTNMFVGGAIFVYGASPTIEECVFAYNSSGIGGGAYLLYSDATIANCLFRNNSAMNGGGLAIVDSNPMLLDVEFLGNQATNYGGAVGVGMTGQAAGDVLLDGCLMRFNSAGVSGGGISLAVQQSQFGVILTDTTVCSNEPDSIDGAWFDQGGNTVCGCPGDITGDGYVNGADLAGMLGSWGPIGDTVTVLADLDASGEVDGADLALLLGVWGVCQ